MPQLESTSQKSDWQRVEVHDDELQDTKPS
jgi:hypothetical protein